MSTITTSLIDLYEKFPTDDFAVLYRNNGVVLAKWREGQHNGLTVADDRYSHHQIDFYLIGAPGHIALRILAPTCDELDRDRPLADYTPAYETSSSYYQAGDISIDDAGLFTAMARQSSASNVDIRWGFTAHLPLTYIEPVRLALAICCRRVEASGNP